MAEAKTEGLISKKINRHSFPRLDNLKTINCEKLRQESKSKKRLDAECRGKSLMESPAMRIFGFLLARLQAYRPKERGSTPTAQGEKK